MRSVIAGLLTIMALAGSAQAEVVQKSEAGFITHASADVTKTPLEVWAELIAPAHWWNKEHSWSGDAANLYIDAQAGGCFCELLSLAKDSPEGTRRGSVEHLRVIYADPGKMMRLSGALGPLQGEALNGTLSITLKQTPKGTRIQWEYVVGGYMRFKPEEIAPAVDGVLSEQLARLAEKLGLAVEAEAVAGSEGIAKPEDTKPVDLAPQGDVSNVEILPPASAIAPTPAASRPAALKPAVRRKSP